MYVPAMSVNVWLAAPAHIPANTRISIFEPARSRKKPPTERHAPAKSDICGVSLPKSADAQ